MTVWVAQWLRKLGHVQSQVLLALVFFAFVIPYALLVRVLGRRPVTGGWFPVREDVTTVESLRRTF